MGTWHERSQKVIGQNCTTFSKRITSYVEGPFPTHIESSDGMRIKASDGREYYDCGGLGSQLIDSHNNFSLPCIEEVQLAERLVETIKMVEKVKFFKSGTMAVNAAVRYARALSGAPGVFWSGYHGSGDTFISQERPGLGCPYINSTKFTDDRKLLEALTGKRASTVGTIIIEPVILVDNSERRELVEKIIKVCHLTGKRVILDEIVTGFRTPEYCYTNLWDLDADLITFGKGLGNGFPIAAVGGKASTMDMDVFVSNTHNGERRSLVEALGVLDLLSPTNLADYNLACHMTKEQFNKWGGPVKLIGTDNRWTWSGKKGDIALMWQEMLKEGFLCGASMFPKMSWVPVILGEFIAASRRVQERFESCTLRGTPAQPAFKRYQ